MRHQAIADERASPPARRRASQRGWRAAARSGSTCPPAARHQQAELLDRAVAASTSPATAPSYMTTIRSASVRISSRSSLIRSTPTPSRRGLAQVLVHGLDRGDVEPTGRRRGDEHAGVARELAAEHDLLEVAARICALRRRAEGWASLASLPDLRPRGWREAHPGAAEMHLF